MTVAQLSGFYKPDFQLQGRQHFAVGTTPPGMEPAARSVSIADARHLQTVEGLSEAAFLARHGFVLISHPTQVVDWDRDVASVYHPEIEQIIRKRLLPGRRVEIGPAPLLRRGRATSVPFYANGVHSDGGFDLEDHLANIRAFAGEEAARRWSERYRQDDVEGLIWLNFWRPTNMTAPLEHMPLAICDPNSLDAGDLIRTGMTGIAPQGRETQHLSIRFSESQDWYVYPRMTCDEVIALKLADFWKRASPLQDCFHAAFHDSEANKDAGERQSCELRVTVLVLRD